ncbi:MAG: hypothetical protein GEV28_15760 [Actinophytocola sp.]|uniref:sigma 54 modulation/S30EA ribosomal C-terminal domain-containing protein n=1 Tax=Actinophytocola sp. TaxID=1872138 RepID=UPI001321C4D6|nr:sigma 54 modulation/S30EA ribosomal C-terminal domain-containing protein [Actinophytocola sp.]MPZ81775.1 hypothetical protein [Actinophytocola sp.]
MSGSIVVQTRGEVLDSAREYVRRQLATFVRRLSDRLPDQMSESSSPGRVRLTAFARPSAPVPALVQANLELGGRAVRAQVAAAFFAEASRLLRARLRDQIALLTGPRQPRRWPQDIAPLHARVQPVGQREIVRRKCYPLACCTVEEAALTMDLMDYDIHLFVDVDTGEDSVVYRVGPTGYRLARLSLMAPPTTPTTVPLTINVHPVPTETPPQAARALGRTDLPYRFFRDRNTGRGTVLYRRYDGHYGQVGPA